VAFFIAINMDLYPFQGILLDKLLEAGHYRMHQHVFTTDMIFMDDAVFGVYWLRIALPKIHYSKSQLKLLQKNKRFSVEIAPLLVTTEMEELYWNYRNSIQFEHVHDLNDYLSDGTPINRFESKQICIYDDKKLIAVGIFDKGTKSIAGIINFFDPSYKKYSLGKQLMLLKCEYAIANQMAFYYPGYIAVGYTKFDYKVFPNIEAVEILDSMKPIWCSYSAEKLASLHSRFEWYMNQTP
jgi:arginine-tRNA-protein transferase